MRAATRRASRGFRTSCRTRASRTRWARSLTVTPACLTRTTSVPESPRNTQRASASAQKAQPAAPQRMNLSKTGIATMIPAREYSPAVLDLLERLVEIGLSGRLAETSIYLPDEVGDTIMPLNTRSARPSLDGMGRYNTSTVHLPPTGVIRLFCFWDEGVTLTCR